MNMLACKDVPVHAFFSICFIASEFSTDLAFYFKVSAYFLYVVTLFSVGCLA